MLEVTKPLRKPSPHHITLAIWLTSANLISLLEILFHLSLSLFFINLQFLFFFLVNKVKHKTLVFKKLSELTDEIKKRKETKKEKEWCVLLLSLAWSTFPLKMVFQQKRQETTTDFAENSKFKLFGYWKLSFFWNTMQFHARIVAMLSQIEFVHSLSSDKRLQWFQDMDYCYENLYMSLPPT